MKLSLYSEPLSMEVQLWDLEESAGPGRWGVQAVKGATGFGATQTLSFSESLAHGALLGGSRFPRRAFNIPLVIDTADADDPEWRLGQCLESLHLVLGQLTELRVRDSLGDLRCTIPAACSDFGQASLGVDTDIETIWTGTITLESPDAFFTAPEPVFVYSELATDTPQLVQFTVEGTAPVNLSYGWRPSTDDGPPGGDPGQVELDGRVVLVARHDLVGGVEVYPEPHVPLRGWVWSPVLENYYSASPPPTAIVLDRSPYVSVWPGSHEMVLTGGGNPSLFFVQYTPKYLSPPVGPALPDVEEVVAA